MLRRRLLLLLLAVLLPAAPVAAQFYLSGNEPASVRWWRIDTKDYRVIYPEGLDSLARVYANTLEQVKMPVGATAGYYPNQNYRKRLPVIIHPWTANANGMVTWTPSRMELFSTPDFSAPLPSPWEQHLVTHESRHVAQMQYGHDGRYRVGSWFLGQLFSGAMDILYCGPAFFEGDAVAAETELTPSGRGRNSAFLEYYRAAFREGDTRDWWKWRYGSLNKYTPDYYTIGYITAAGMRSVYDTPDFTARYYQRMFRKRWPFPVLNYPKTVKEVSGKKFKAAFAEICDTLQTRWSRDEAARGPFMPSRRVTPSERYYAEYSDGCYFDSTLFSVRQGLTGTPQIVRVDSSGKATAVRGFSYSASRLKPDETLGRMYWSELIRHPRWEMKSWSEIHWCNAAGVTGCIRRHTRWYNPAVAPDGLRLSVTEYPVTGGSALLVVDAMNGEEQERFDAPAGMQLVESEWVDGTLYACAITAEGQGLYDVKDGFRRVLACGYNVVKGLFSRDGRLYFSSDLGGVDELYAFDPGTGEAQRISNCEQGASSFIFSPDGSTLLYSALDGSGRHICATPVDSLPAPSRADFGVAHRYEFAEEVAAGGPGIPGPEPVEMSEPKRYSRLANLFRVHSWAPIYIDYDAVADVSFESLTSAAGLGASAFFQNDLGTFDGVAGYRLGFDDDWKPNHLVSAKVTYRGFWPVIEAGASVGSEPPTWYFLDRRFSEYALKLNLGHKKQEGYPSVSTSLLVYVPMNFSSTGWYRGVVPQVRWNASNSMVTRGSSSIMNRLSVSLRGYTMQATPASCVYPKLGIGAEAGWSGRPGGLGIFSSNAYLYSYAYLPGFAPTHGFRWSGTLQMPVGDGIFSERYANIMPRGMGDYTTLASQAAAYPLQARVTLDYAMPFASLDWSGLGNFAYVRNLECIFHGDYSYMGGASKADSMHLGAVGLDLCVVLGNLLWIPDDTRVGVRYYYNLGAPDGKSPHFVDAVFSVDL